MTKEELAERLNDTATYRREIDPETERLAKEAGLVVVFGASDDLIELRGAIDDEISAFDGGEFLVTQAGLVVNKCAEGDYCPNFAKGVGTPVEALWCAEDDGPSWSYRTKIPHATFDVYDDDEYYCRGIVFALADVP